MKSLSLKTKRIIGFIALIFIVILLAVFYEPVNQDRIYCGSDSNHKNMDRCMSLAQRYDRGEGVKEDKEKAFRFYRKACVNSFLPINAKACYNTGLMLDKGEGTLQDTVQAAKFYEKACPSSQSACNNLASIHLNFAEDGIDAAQNYEKAFRLYEQICLDDAPPLSEWGILACHNTGVGYAHGLIGVVDQEQAAKFYEKACPSSADACDNLVLVHQNLAEDGIDAAQNYEKAFRLYEQICLDEVPPRSERGIRACHNTGVGYADGLIGVVDQEQAAKFYEKACPSYANACNNLALIRHNLAEDGIDAAQNYEKAIELFEIACSGGTQIACNNLALFQE